MALNLNGVFTKGVYAQYINFIKETFLNQIILASNRRGLMSKEFAVVGAHKKNGKGDCEQCSYVEARIQEGERNTMKKTVGRCHSNGFEK